MFTNSSPMPRGGNRLTGARRFLSSVLTASLVATTAVALTARAPAPDADHERDERVYAIALWGDLPYSPLQATVGVPNLIADTNQQDLAFTVRDGDLKAGSGSPCNDALYVQALGYFNSLKAPAAFTPGDNDWTDCDRPSNDGFSSLERLDHERQVLFSRPFSFGPASPPSGGSDRPCLPRLVTRPLLTSNVSLPANAPVLPNW